MEIMKFFNGAPKMVCFLLSSLLLLIVMASATATTMEAASNSSSEAEIIARFQQYLRINTCHPNPNYYEAADFLITQAKSMSLESQTLEFVKEKPFVLLKWPGSNPNLPAILLYSHTDIVPAEPHKWKYDPLGAHMDKKGDIYARGSQDMKCVGMQYMEAVRRLKANGFQPLRSIYLAFGPDEETGGVDGAAKFVEADLLNKLNIGVGLDEGLASPTENYRVFYGEKSPWRMVIKATGEPGHGSMMYDNSAWENLFKSVESITRFRASQFDLVKQGLQADGDTFSVNLAYLKAGIPFPTRGRFMMNVQPSEVEAGFDVRVPPTADPKAMDTRIAQEWAPASRNMTYYKEPVQLEDGKPIITKTDGSNHWWGLLEDAVRRAGGKLERPEIFPAATDSRFFGRHGLPAFGFSPIANTPVLLHDHNEFLNRDVYLKGIEMYESIIKAFASYEGNADSKDEL